MSRLAVAGAELGALTISLIWETNVDLDLHCKTTRGEEIFFSNRHSSCGGYLDVDMTSSSSATPAVENIFWKNAPPGRYEWWVHNYSSTNVPVNFWVREKHKGKVIMHQGNTGMTNNSSRRTINYQDPLTVAAQTRLQPFLSWS